MLLTMSIDAVREGFAEAGLPRLACPDGRKPRAMRRPKGSRVGMARLLPFLAAFRNVAQEAMRYRFAHHGRFCRAASGTAPLPARGHVARTVPHAKAQSVDTAVVVVD
jgi:hypothetical protein